MMEIMADINTSHRRLREAIRAELTDVKNALVNAGMHFPDSLFEPIDRQEKTESSIRDMLREVNNRMRQAIQELQEQPKVVAILITKE